MTPGDSLARRASEGGVTTSAARFVIARVTAGEGRELVPVLTGILRDVVNGGASVGFLPPLGVPEAEIYWGEVITAVARGSRVLLVARDTDGAGVGTAQLDLCVRANGRHRGEVMKVMVSRAMQRRGIGRALMLAVEDEARRAGLTTLVLDTRAGDPSEALYVSLGYERAGVIPRYARSANGALDASVFYYRLLDATD